MNEKKIFSIHPVPNGKVVICRLGLFHLNVHGGGGGGGGVERSPIKKSWGEGVKMKKLGGYMKKIIGGGSEIVGVPPPPPPPPHVHSN